MRRRNRSTRSGGIKLPDYDVARGERVQRNGTRRMVRALMELVRARRRMEHMPTLMQVRALAHFDGRERSSYLLDPEVNFVPELPLRGEDPLGRHALRFTGSCPHTGRRVELVMLPDGCTFDLLGMSRWPGSKSTTTARSAPLNGVASGPFVVLRPAKQPIAPCVSLARSRPAADACPIPTLGGSKMHPRFTPPTAGTSRGTSASGWPGSRRSHAARPRRHRHTLRRSSTKGTSR